MDYNIFTKQVFTLTKCKQARMKIIWMQLNIRHKSDIVTIDH